MFCKDDGHNHRSLSGTVPHNAWQSTSTVTSCQRTCQSFCVVSIAAFFYGVQAGCSVMEIYEGMGRMGHF